MSDGRLYRLLPAIYRERDAAATKRRFGGLGMGLSLVKRLVELHGGYVKARSAGENQGATFVVALPLAAVHDHGVDEGDRQHPRSQLSRPAMDVDLPGRPSRHFFPRSVSLRCGSVVCRCDSRARASRCPLRSWSCAPWWIDSSGGISWVEGLALQ